MLLLILLLLWESAGLQLNGLILYVTFCVPFSLPEQTRPHMLDLREL